MNKTEAESFRDHRLFHRIELFERGHAVVFTEVSEGVGTLWRSEGVSYEAAETKASMAASEALIASYARSKVERKREAAQNLNQYFAEMDEACASLRAVDEIRLIPKSTPPIQHHHC